MAEAKVNKVPNLNLQGLDADKEKERHISGTGSTKSKTPSKYAKKDTDRSEGRSSSLPRSATTPRQKKIGHRRVDALGETTYKKTTSSALMNAIQLGIGHSVGSLSAKPERDLLLQDFPVVESITFPSEGSNITPAHPYSDYRFKTYSPIAFRYFRDLFGIQPDDFLISLVDKPLVELSNPGASGSVFYLTQDDEFIIKTVQHKEADFLQKLLPGYYMNLNQNPRTLLPKFYGLYTYQSGGRNIRLIVMNNLMPSQITMHNKFDLKGSTFKRKASKAERQKKLPTLKDLDFLSDFKDGIFLDGPTYNALMKTIQRDCRVLESFKIMDYSLLLSIHNIDQAKREKQEKEKQEKDGASTSSPPKATHSPRRTKSEIQRPVSRNISDVSGDESGGAKAKPIVRLERSKSYLNRQRVAAFSTTREAIQGSADTLPAQADDEEDEESTGGIPAKNSKGERLLLFIGIIDILQCYKLQKKFEHTFKAMIHDGDTVSVHRPSYYAARFQDFMTKNVFKKMPTAMAQDAYRERLYRAERRTNSRQESSRSSATSVKMTVPKDWSLPPTYDEFVRQSGGAKPKTPRPDIVPNTPPKDDQEILAEPLPEYDDDDEPIASASKQSTTSTNNVKFMTPPPTRSVNVSEMAIQTDTGVQSEPFPVEELNRKLSEVDESVLKYAARPGLNTMFPTTPTTTPTTSPGTMTPPSMSTPHTYSGSSTIDTASESSPLKMVDVSYDSMESPAKFSSPAEVNVTVAAEADVGTDGTSGIVNGNGDATIDGKIGKTVATTEESENTTL